MQSPMQRISTFAAGAVLAGVVAVGAWEMPATKTASGIVATRNGGLEGVGTIQYDPPGAADTFIGAPGAFYGNLFDTAGGAPLATGSVTGLAFYHGGTDATFPYVGLFGPGLTTLFAPAISGIVPLTFNTVPVTGVAAVAPSFMAGVLVSSAFGSSADSVGARSASTDGQGFHALNIQSGTVLSNLNAMVRVSGSVFIPAELVGFEVE